MHPITGTASYLASFTLLTLLPLDSLHSHALPVISLAFLRPDLTFFFSPLRLFISFEQRHVAVQDKGLGPACAALCWGSLLLVGRVSL